MKADLKSSYLLSIIFKGVKIMILKLILLITYIALFMFWLSILLPKLKTTYKMYKKLKEKEQREESFKRKMKELEIK